MEVVERDVFDRILQLKRMAFVVQVTTQEEYPIKDTVPDELKPLI